MSLKSPESINSHTSELSGMLQEHLANRKAKKAEEAQQEVVTSTINDDHWRPVSNVISEELFVIRIKKVANEIASILNKTFGPGGGFTICAPDSSADETIVTKDGYHIMKEIHFVDEFSSTILRSMRDASRRVAKNAGDGSTSAVIMANHIIQNIFSKPQQFSKPMLNAGVTAFETVLLKYIDEELAMNVRDSDLETIAKIATNNNPVLGKYISDLVIEATKTTNEPIIQVGLSKDEDDHVTTQNGFRLYVDILDELFYNDTIGNAKAAKSSTPVNILAIKAEVNNEVFNGIIQPVMQECLSANEGVVVIAKSFTKDVERALMSIKMRESLAPIWFFTTGIEERNSQRFDDFCTYIDCLPVTNEILDMVLQSKAPEINLEHFVGRATNFDMHSSRLIVSANDNERLTKLITTLKENIQSVNTRDAADVYGEANKEFNSRLANLEAKAVHVAVGGKSESERKSRADAIEDAVFACLAAKKSGYIAGGGGGLGILKHLLAEDMNIREQVSNILIQDYKYSKKASDEVSRYVQMLFCNAYVSTLENVFEKIYVPAGLTPSTIIQQCIQNQKEFDAISSEFVERTIISPASTDIEILKGTVSIIKSIACSNQFLFTQAHKNT